MSKEFKVIESTIQPNPKEAEIWMTPASQDGTREIKHYNNVSKKWEGVDSTNTNVLHIGGHGYTFGDDVYTNYFIDAYISLDTFEIIENNSMQYCVEGGENDPQIIEEPLDLRIDGNYVDYSGYTEYSISFDGSRPSLVLSFQTKEKDWEVIIENHEYVKYITAAIQHVVVYDHSEINVVIENNKRKVQLYL